jgi:hypothetical protein
LKYVTSFSAAGYKLYGRKFLETFVEHHQDVIWVYAEDTALDLRHPRIVVKDLFKVPGCVEFLQQCQFPAFQGRLWGENKRNYRYDAFTFCRKSFAQCDAAASGGDWLVWIDADVELAGTLPAPSGSHFMSYLGRPAWHSCASYVAWNLGHPVSGLFWERYRALYVTGTVFALREWHDSYVLDTLRTNLQLPAVNLAADIPPEKLDGSSNVFDLVFPMGHHKKGRLKLAD